jgi:hypothetical protein
MKEKLELLSKNKPQHLKITEEALTRLGEITAIITSDLLSGKAKMQQLTDLIGGYGIDDSHVELGGCSVCNNRYFGESRQVVSLGDLITKSPLNLQVDVFKSRHK